MTTYRPFDLEAAKAGAKVQTNTPVVGWIDVHFVGVSEKGNYVVQKGKELWFSDRQNLVMSPTTRTVWRVIYRDENNNAAQRDFETKDEAYQFCYSEAAKSYISPFTVEITQ